ncbi:hypothetical protein GE21DRAFT_2387 [Neurospora crassa]|uniref:Uncharacterized protein n=1 Tax=Neurospora crassa (strain ATCC 24698 / 74-OR23-1A / CBS 708.71 / DSM 1257 / FGSC 987) TaxID=367110 RepID=V5IQN8_NEUCR|nr:hypothetical protein NCU16473 [Neurospora crassa OR74A]ESA44367.1 hypothetical protein NCU16473 [Neurospora crassa OR74A]KHE89317.1 hypothetical protein GE21DRAFT_2387 [Neurospora crassa]|eukprot:XP_011393434.1 hypothetical protein NCU16473 [Neurospora crassa OR74A]
MPPAPEPKSKAAVPQGKRDVGRRTLDQGKIATLALSPLPMKEQLQKSVLLQKPKEADSQSEPPCKDDLASASAAAAAAAAAADDDWVLEDLVEKEEEEGEGKDDDDDDDDWFFEVPLLEEEDWVTVTLDSRDGKWA